MRSIHPSSTILILSLACTPSAFFHGFHHGHYGALAFVTPSRPHELSKNALIGNIIDSRFSPDRHCSTRLWAEAVNDDDDSSDSNETPKAMHKGTQKKSPSNKQSSSNGNKKSTANNKAKTKSKPTKRKITKGSATSSSKKKSQTKKTPLEISAQSLSPSQTAETSSEQPSLSSEQTQTNNEDDQNYAYNIPKTGYSLADQLENQSPENKERFETLLTPIVTGIHQSSVPVSALVGLEGEQDGVGGGAAVEFQYDEDGFPIGYTEATKVDEEESGKEGEEGSASSGSAIRRQHQGVARIDTMSTLGNVGEEPVRWIVSLGNDVDGNSNNDDASEGVESFAMIDLPPYSDKLADEIRYFMDPTYNQTRSTPTDDDTNNANTKMKRASLDVILLTNQQCIHYDTTPAVYVTRKSDMTKWKNAFPTAKVIMYRLDIPRECREEVTQVLDGYGPWGWKEEDGEFVETGRPLKIEEWDEDTMSKVLTQGELPPDDLVVDNEEEDTTSSSNEDEDELYSTEAIRKREEQYRLLAVYTPGHTFGSVTYIFPKRGICCSGYTLPLESTLETTTTASREDDDDGEYVGTGGTSNSFTPPQGPRLDYQGYLATSASRPRQMSSASSLITNYIDRYRVVLPARGDVVFLDSNVDIRKRELMESVGLYQKIGDIYGRLGIVE